MESNSVPQTANGNAVGQLFSNAASAIGTLAAMVLQFLSDFIDVVETANVLAERHAWVFSQSWPMSLVLKVGLLAREKQRSGPAVARLLVDFYHENDWLELERLLDGTAAYRVMKPPRMRILRNALGSLRAADKLGSFNAADVVVPTLIGQLEGFVRDFDRHHLPQLSRRRSVAAIVAELNKVAQPCDAAGLRLLRDIVFRPWQDQPPQPGYRFNRNTIVHGTSLWYGRLDNVVRVFLMIDFVGYLTDEWIASRVGDRESVPSKRAQYAEFLSLCRATSQTQRSNGQSVLEADGVQQSQSIPTFALSDKDRLSGEIT